MLVADAEPSLDRFPRPFGKFELLYRLGDGGMAEVYLAQLPGIEGFRKTLVIKRILPHLARKKRFVDMFIAEASLAAEVRHRNIVQVYELGRVDNELYMAMEYIQGTDLRVLLSRSSKRGLRIPPWFSVHLICEVLEALAFAWSLRDKDGRPRHIVHRDVTPSNIFISDQGEVKLGDFGVARDDTRDSETRAGQLKGKLAYMAPEQLYSEKPDHQFDVFSAGVVLWEALAQRRLFGGQPEIDIMHSISQGPRLPPSTYVADIPKKLDNIVLAALEIEKRNRTPSAQAFQHQLLSILPSLRSQIRPSNLRHVVAEILGHESPEAFGLEPTSLRSLQDLRRAPTQSTPLIVGRPLEAPSSDLIEDLNLDPAQPDQSPLNARETPRAPAQSPGSAQTYPSVEDEALEALVSDAVSSIQSVEPNLEVVPKDHMLAGIEHRRLMGNNRQLKSERWSFILDQEVYDGPYPFWVKDHEGTEIGPCSFHQAFQIVKVQCQAGLGYKAYLSTARGRWLPMTAFLSISGMETLIVESPPDMGERPSWCGRIDDHSLGSILAALTRAQANGRLLIEMNAHNLDGHWIIETTNGQPVFVSAYGESLQFPQLLVNKGILHERLLPRILHEVLSQREPLAKVLSHVANIDLRQYFPILMKERIASLLSSSYARFTFDSRHTPAHRRPFAKSLLAPWAELLSRSLTPTQLETRLHPVLQVPLEAVLDFADMVKLLALKPAQQQIAERLRKKKRIARLLDSSNRAEDRTIRIVAYILIEAELLRPTY